jgi:hypothetical protein
MGEDMCGRWMLLCFLGVMLAAALLTGCAMDPPLTTPSASTTKAIIAESHRRIEEDRKKREAAYQDLEQQYRDYEQRFWPHLRENFPPLAKQLNYVCDRVTGFRPVEATERGQVYRIDCDGSLSYRMLKTPDEKLIITPWRYR